MTCALAPLTTSLSEPSFEPVEIIRNHAECQLTWPSPPFTSTFFDLRRPPRQAVSVGVVPQSCAVTLFGALVAAAQPGDAVMVEGGA